MGRSDYTDAIKRLEKDKSRLMSELLIIETALTALTKLSHDVTVGKPIEPSISFTGGHLIKSVKSNPYEHYNIEVPSVYDKELPMVEKLLFALKQKNGSFAQDAAEFIAEIDDSENLEMLKRRFTDIASGLGRAKKLNTKKIGKKYKYSIIETDEQKRVA